MTNIRNSIPKPAPISTTLTQPWWAAAEQGTLLLQRCRACGKYQHYLRSLCTGCWSDALDWATAAGGGAIWTYTVAHVPGHPAWTPEVPYVIALVELDEGPRLLTNILADPQEVSVGQRVRLAQPGDRSDQRLIQFVIDRP